MKMFGKYTITESLPASKKCSKEDIAGWVKKQCKKIQEDFNNNDVQDPELL